MIVIQSSCDVDKLSVIRRLRFKAVGDRAVDERSAAVVRRIDLILHALPVGERVRQPLSGKEIAIIK